MKKFLLIVFLLIETISAQYKVSTFAGTGNKGFENGTLTEASFNGAFGMCLDAGGNIYVADAGNNCIRKIDKNGNVTTFAGNGSAGNVDGPAESAQFNSPTGICADENGNFYVADFLNHTIREISSDGNVTTVAGSGQPGYADGFGDQAMFNYPRGIAIDSDGVLYVGDSWNHRIRKITPDGDVTTFAGGGDDIGTESKGSWVDGPDTTARFFTPCGVAVDNFNNVYVADALNHRIRKIDPVGNVTTIAGSGDSGWENGGFNEGSPEDSQLNTPTELFVTNNGEVLFSGTFANRVRKIDLSGEVITIAGDGNPGMKNGDGKKAEFNYPRGIISNPEANIIRVFDYNNNVIRLIENEE